MAHSLSYYLFQDQPSNFDVLLFLVTWIGVCTDAIIQRLSETPGSKNH